MKLPLNNATDKKVNLEINAKGENFMMRLFVAPSKNTQKKID
jgi:hypothetical protein